MERYGGNLLLRAVAHQRFSPVSAARQRTRGRRRLPLLMALLLPCAAQAADPAAAEQTASESATAVFDAAYFAAYRPITLQDMLDRIPGISLAFRQTEERRGLRSNSDQILINGKQISAKDNNSQTVLRRISASQVERIEVIRGSVAELESTSSRVINIVLKTEGRHTWSYFLGGVGYRDGTIRPLGTTGYAYDALDRNANVAAFSDVSYRPWERLEVGRTPANVPIADTRDDESALNQYYRLTGNFDFRLPRERELQLNALAQHRDIDRELRRVSRSLGAAGGTVVSDTFERDYRNREAAEFGVDHEVPFASGRFTTVALFNIETEDKDREVRNLAVPGSPLLTLEERADLKTESILRGTYDRPLAPGQGLKLGIEAAFNVQDTVLDLFTVVRGIPTRVPIFNNDTRIEESRGELFAAHRWEPSAKWQVESGLTLELSDLEQTGRDVNSSRSLQYLKPTLEVFYKPSAADKLWGTIRRDVSQLDFLEFIATLRTEDQVLDQGNPDLLPERSWDLETGWEHKLADGGGFLSARAFHRQVSDVSEKIAFRGILSQPGNIGSGREYGAELEASLKFAALGLWDGTLTSTFLRRHTQVTDPFNGRSRTFAGKPDYEASVIYKHEIKPLSTLLTFIVNKNAASFDYDLDRIESLEDDVNLSIFADVTLYRQFSLHVEVGNITNRVSTRERSVYAINAIDGRIGRYDEREATWGRYWLLSFKGQF